MPFDAISHYRHLAAQEREHAAEIRAGKVQNLPLGSAWIDYHAELCERNAVRFEAMADDAAASSKRAA